MQSGNQINQSNEKVGINLIKAIGDFLPMAFILKKQFIMKRTIKKTSYLLLSIGLVLFNACSNSNSVDTEIDDGTNEEPPVEQTDEAPVWTLSLGQNNYEFNMTYSSQIAFNNTVNKNTGTIISAFVGNECRGVARLTHEPGINIYVFNLTIYSNAPSGEDIIIKAYNADQKKLFDQCTTFKFESDDSKGSVDEILNCVIK